jgi:hypothetical protein
MEIRIKHNISTLEQALRQAPEIMERNLEPFVNRAAQEVAREERHVAPKAFSILANSLHVVRVTNLHYRATTNINYAGYVEEGTKPHFPNPSNLVPWVRRVLGVPADDAEGVAFAIARSISRRGIRAQPFAKPTRDKMESRVLALLGQGVEAGIREAFA